MLNITTRRLVIKIATLLRTKGTEDACEVVGRSFTALYDAQFSTRSAQQYSINISNSKEAIFLWVQSDPAKASLSEQQYVDNICKGIQSRTRVDDILESCVKPCWDKTLHRCSLNEADTLTLRSRS